MKGKEWTEEEIAEIVPSLQPYLEMGFSRNKACRFIGLAPQTLSNWVKANPALGIKIEGWENVINTIAINNIAQAVKKEAELDDDLRKENSWKWAERRMKEDFSTRNETDITTLGERLTIAFDSSFNDTTRTTEENSTE